jgi:TolB-like protein/tRNA A-37 threonylcarbamoyl transferase component Bud32
MTLAAGTRLGPYEILSALGAGGMGEVYKARDTRLDRIVAIKQLIPRHLDRFEREARAIAALNHPHICQVYDVGPDYLVLEYLEGRPLQGPMAEDEAVRLGIQIASALDAAHARAILHRDLKPANIVLVRRGGSSGPPDAKLLDFGLAKLLDDQVDTTKTMDGAVVGTAAYMSPEQAEGRTLDARSDVFSFGAVLYEMLAGRRAFEGDTTVHVLSAVLGRQPRPLTARPALVTIVMRCLAKEPGERFQSMADVMAALTGLTANRGGSPPSIAVLPFANMSGDKENEYFADGLAEEVLNALAQIAALKVIARTSSFAFKGKNEDVRRIAETLGVTHILEGSVRRAGDRIRVTAQLIAAADGSHLWSERYDRPMADVFAVQDEIAQAIAEALRVKLAESVGHRHYTPPLPAYDAFLRGRHHVHTFSPERLARSRASFEEAIALDPNYADPHAELGLAYFLIGMHGLQPLADVVPKIRREAQRALDLNPSEPQPRFLLGAVAAAYDYDWSAAAEHFQAARTTKHISADARWAYASLYLEALGRVQESSAEMARAVEQDPLNATWRAIWSAHLRNAKDYPQAIAQAQKAVELDEEYFVPQFILGEAYLASHRVDDAILAFEKARRAAPWNAMCTGNLAGALFLRGEKARAAELIRVMGDTPIPVWGRVLYHLHIGELDAAADWYEKMIEQRDPFAIVYANSPLTRVLRETARWPPLARAMNLPAVSSEA